jgi:hypothetical protein
MEEHSKSIHRHLGMLMKSRTLFYIATGLLIFGIAIFIFFTRTQKSAQIFPATVNRDCAPWDGSAFRVSIPLEDGTVIDIAIWQAPDIRFSKTFSFPDDAGQVGNASLRSASDEYQQLSGTVFFQRVNEGSPVDGRFELTTEAGQRFEGQFKAEWENTIALCG